MTISEPVIHEAVELPHHLPQATGVDCGLTLAKIARCNGKNAVLTAYAGVPPATAIADGRSSRLGVTGALAGTLRAVGAVRSQEIEAAARGVIALGAGDDDFILVLLGTGTSFAAVRRRDGAPSVTHLGGTPLGGGSFRGIARRLAPPMTHKQMIAAAARGDRRVVDVMIADFYPEGIGRVSADLTAAHLSSGDDGSVDDVLAALLNLHGEAIGQIGASRARIAGIGRLLLAGGFVHDNPTLSASTVAMAALFGIRTEVAPHPGFAGAVGAAVVAAEAEGNFDIGDHARGED